MMVATSALLWSPALVNASAGEAASTASEATATAAQAPAVAAKQGLERYKEEPVPGGLMLLIAYMVMWGLAIALVIRLLVSQSKLQAAVTELEERIGDDQGP